MKNTLTHHEVVMKGGLATKKKYGLKHYKRISKMAIAARKAKQK